jgi:hypothetical protein
MLKEYDNSKETAEEKAKRKWRNNAVRQRFIEKREGAQKAIAEAEESEPPKLADIIENDGRRHGPIQNFESKFKREIREMLRGHVDRNLVMYAASLRHQKRRLLLEKLRRLEARAAQQSQ